MSNLEPAKTLVDWLTSLRSTGRAFILLSNGEKEADAKRRWESEARSVGVTKLLRTWHAAAGLELAHSEPEFHETAAQWGALMLLRAAWAYLFRETDPKEVVTEFQSKLPDPDNPAAHFSADLTLCWLPDYFRLAQAIADHDPVLAALNQLGGQVPLSSIGVGDCAPDEAALATLRQHPGLWRAYLDRILRLRDRQRLEHPLVQESMPLANFPGVAPSTSSRSAPSLS
jgi:hypothetical protein